MSGEGRTSPAGAPHLKVMLAGGLAGAFAKTCTAPLGRITILFQLGSLRGYDSVWPATKHLIQTQGVLSLWRGHTATLLHRVPYSSVNFMVFEHTKKLLAPVLKNREEGGSYLSEGVRFLIAGAAGGSSGCAFAYPLDLAKTRMAGSLSRDVPSHGALIQCFQSIIAKEGFFGLYKGLSATLLQVTPTLAINFTAYELTKGFLTPLLQPQPASAEPLSPPPGVSREQLAGRIPLNRLPAATDPASGGSAALSLVLVEPDASSVPPPDSPQGGAEGGERGREVGGGYRTGVQPSDMIYRRVLVSLVAGSVAGVVSSTSTFPLDVVRRRVQMAAGDTSYEQIVRKMYKEGGMREFYRGLVPEYLKVIPGVSIAFCAYEVLKVVLGV